MDISGNPYFAYFVGFILFTIIFISSLGKIQQYSQEQSNENQISLLQAELKLANKTLEVQNQVIKLMGETTCK